MAAGELPLGDDENNMDMSEYLLVRENWMAQVFSHTKIAPRDKLVLVALAFWYLPPGVHKPLDCAAIAQLTGLKRDETREVVMRLATAGILQLHEDTVQ